MVSVDKVVDRIERLRNLPNNYDLFNKIEAAFEGHSFDGVSDIIIYNPDSFGSWEPGEGEHIVQIDHAEYPYEISIYLVEDGIDTLKVDSVEIIEL